MWAKAINLLDPLRFGESGVIHARLHQAEFLAYSPLVRIGVLAQIECCQMKAEAVEGRPSASATPLPATRTRVRCSRLLCHRVRTARRNAISFALSSAAVRKGRPRAARSSATSSFRSIVLLRLTSFE